MTIKEAFEALSSACAKGMKNPFFVMRNLSQNFANVADKIEETKSTADYSTTEVDTNIKWTDGKPIYMRTFTNVSLPQNGYSATLDLGVEADTIVKIEANDGANAGNATIIFAGVYAKINKVEGSNTILNPTNQLAALTGATLTVYYTKA